MPLYTTLTPESEQETELTSNGLKKVVVELSHVRYNLQRPMHFT